MTYNVEFLIVYDVIWCIKYRMLLFCWRHYHTLDYIVSHNCNGAWGQKVNFNNNTEQ